MEVPTAVEAEGGRGITVMTVSETEDSGVGVSADDASIDSVEVVLSDGGARVGSTVNIESEVVGSNSDEDSGGITSLVDSSVPVVDDVSELITGRSCVLSVVDDSALMTVGSSASVDEKISVEDDSSEGN